MMSHRENEKYTKGFIIKCMNVIIESRLGESVVRKCSPTRNDWFNIAINDNEEVTQSCLDCLDSLHWIDPKVDDQKLTSGFTVDTRWKVACEISLKTQDGKLISLEYWMFENNPVNSQPNTPSGANSPTGASPSSDPSVSTLINSRTTNSFASVHSRMGLMLKSLMSLTRGSPAFKLSYVDQGDQSHVIFYRITQCDVDFESFIQSINPDTKEILKIFSQETRLGSICTNHNSIGISFSHRLKIDSCFQERPFKAEDNLIIKEDHFGGARRQDSPDDRNSPCFVSKAREPLLAFGSISPVVLPFPLLPPLPKGFPGISDDEDDDENTSTDSAITTPTITTTTTSANTANVTATVSSAGSASSSASTSDKSRKESPANEIKVEKKLPNASKPIVIPSDRRNYRVDNSPVGSCDSYVFIENRPPFAPDHDDIEILFTGPTPSFVMNPSGGGELTNIQETLAAMESEMETMDAFLELLNLKSGEDEDLAKSTSSSK